jgi:predicted nicotinamide N-methyase
MLSTCKVTSDIREEVEDIFDAELFIDRSYSLKTVVIGNVSLQLYALHNAATTDHDLTGQIVWPAAKLLASFLTQHVDIFCSEVPMILELGAGAGLSGLVAAMLCRNPSNVILTDNNELVLDLLERNINVNFTDQQRKPRCYRLGWGKQEAEQFSAVHGNFDVILGADVVFWPAAIPLLFETVHYFLTQQPSAKFVLSYINRSELSTKLLFDHAHCTI